MQVAEAIHFPALLPSPWPAPATTSPPEIAMIRNDHQQFD